MSIFNVHHWRVTHQPPQQEVLEQFESDSCLMPPSEPSIHAAAKTSTNFNIENFQGLNRSTYQIRLVDVTSSIE